MGVLFVQGASTNGQIISAVNYNRYHVCEDESKQRHASSNLLHAVTILRSVIPPGTSPVSGYYFPPEAREARYRGLQ